jgi:hypothetical protein
MFAARITCSYLAVSAAMKLAKFDWDPPKTIPLNSAIRALMFGLASAAFTSPFNLSMICMGVLFGAPKAEP